MFYRGKFRDYSESLFKASGKTILDLIRLGWTNDEIREEFKRLKLQKPTRGYLDAYRAKIGDIKKLGEEVSYQFREFVRSRSGLARLSVESVLDAVILSGFSALQRHNTVSITELLKALELRHKINSSSGGKFSYEEINKQIEEIFKGKEKDGEEQGKPFSEAEVLADTSGDTVSFKSCEDTDTSSAAEER